MLFQICITRGLTCHRFELRSLVRKMPRRPTTAQKLDLANKRRKLRNRITAFLNTAVQYLGDDANDIIYEVEHIVFDQAESQESSPEDNDSQTPGITAADPERQVLPFPSAVSDDSIKKLPVDQQTIILALRQTELQIREGHADEALEHVRTAVIHLSWEFKNKVRLALTGTEKTKTWDKVKLLTRLWKHHRKVYNYNRSVMIALGDKEAIERKFPELELRDCQVNTAVARHNLPGQSTDRLPWFWSSAARVGATSALDGQHSNECNVIFSRGQITLSTESWYSLPSKLATCQSSTQSLGRGTSAYTS